MTLPDERYRAVMQAKRLLEELCDPKMTPRVAIGIRDRARGVLRHFPENYILEDMTELEPQYFAKEMEPLYRMVLKYDQDKENGK